MKFDSFFDWIISFGAGSLFTLIISSMIYGAGSPRIVIILAISVLVGFIGAFVAYCFGKRRAEIIIEHQKYVEFDN